MPAAFAPPPRRPGRRLARIACAALLLACAAAHAGKPENITDAEIALLPPYCADANTIRYGDAFYNTSPNAQKWVNLMGKGFWAIHHYCWALVNLARVQKPSVPISVQQWTREAAVGDLYYVVQNTTPDFIMLPEIYTKIGELKLALGKPIEAHEAFAEAWTRKRDYWPPYYHWAEYLRVSGQKQKAREVAEEGLSYAADAKPLASLYREMGGNPATVVRREPPAAATSSAEGSR